MFWQDELKAVNYHFIVTSCLIFYDCESSHFFNILRHNNAVKLDLNNEEIKFNTLLMTDGSNKQMWMVPGIMTLKQA